MKNTAEIIDIKTKQQYKKSFKVQDHIGIFDNYFTDKLCDKYISFFDKVTLSEDRDKLQRVQDKHFSILTKLYDNDLNINYIGADFQRVFWTDIYPKYIEKYPIIKAFNKHRILDIKIQKTKKGQGYHQWHCELMDASSRNRFLVFSLYLNTVKGGETEFLNQGLRLEAVKDRFIMFPSTYTHVHRGNPPLDGTKYIITGWVEFGE